MKDEWSFLQKTGILRKNLITFLWKDLVEDHDDILELLENLDLLCKVPSSHEVKYAFSAEMLYLFYIFAHRGNVFHYYNPYRFVMLKPIVFCVFMISESTIIGKLLNGPIFECQWHIMSLNNTYSDLFLQFR